MRRLLPIVALALLLAGCGGETVSPVPETVIGTIKQGPSGSAAGKEIYASNGCGGCHTFKPAGSAGKVGPDLDKLAADAETAGDASVEDYTRESIEDPGAYVVPGYPNGVMPAYEGQLTESQVDDLVAFLTSS
jgi:mono/diheme cytochrome c family protein